MKIDKIERATWTSDDHGLIRTHTSSTIFKVTFKPNWFEKLFGVKHKVVKYKRVGYVYIREDGVQLTPKIDWVVDEINKWRNKF